MCTRIIFNNVKMFSKLCKNVSTGCYHTHFRIITLNQHRFLAVKKSSVSSEDYAWAKGLFS